MRRLLLSAMMMAMALTKGYTQETESLSEPSVPAAEAATPLEASAPKRALGTNQKYMGPYESDDITHWTSYAGQAGFRVGEILRSSYVQKYDGGKIVAMRFGTHKDVGAVRVFVIPVNNGDVMGGDAVSQEVMGDDVVSQEVSTTSKGWNYVQLTTPYTISSDGANTFLIGYEYLDSLSSYPVSFAGDPSDGFYRSVLYNGYRSGKWYKTENEGQGYVCVQCIVEKDGINEIVDASIHSMNVPSVVKKGETTKVKFRSYNFSKAVTACDFGISIDGSEVATLNGCTVKGDTATFSTDVTIGNTCTEGQKHELAVYLKSVNGAAPAGDTTDDKAASTFMPYTKTAQRQMSLLEEETATWCYACTLADKGITRLMGQRNDIAWVAMHTYSDLKVAKTQYIRDFFDYSGLPNGSFNRCLLDGEAKIAYSLGWTDTDYLAGMLNDKLDESIKECPTFTQLDISAIYDEPSHNLAITVKGTGVEHAAQLMADDILTVYLTEDNVVATQWNGYEYDENYVHTAVLRSVLSGKYGDNITWDGDNFEMTYNTTLDEAWDAAQMHIIAATSRTFYDSEKRMYKKNLSDAWVSNANSMAVKDAATGVESVGKAAGKQTVSAYYTIGGQRLDALQKGVNIIRFADGTARKVVVR